MWKSILSTLSVLLLGFGCAASSKRIPAVTPFDVTRYMGQWYEIVRLPNTFETGLEQITAEYFLNENGTVKVTNSGLNTKTNQRNTAIGKAKQIKPNTGELKVSFFGPFYGGYRVIDLDQEKYSYTMITSGGMNYFWILSREKEMPKEQLEKLVQKAKDWGFETDKLIYVRQ